MPNEQQPQQNAETVARIFMSMLDDFNGLLKLYFTLSTGAVVLFVNALLITHATRWVLTLLVISIFAFGAASLTCMQLLLEMVNYRMEITSALLQGLAVSTLKERLDVWTNRTKRTATSMEWLFRGGIFLAAAFVIAILTVH